MSTPRLRIGQLLVDAKLITAEALAETLEAQRKDPRRLGTLLVERGLLNETQLTQILSHQLSVPWVSLLHIEFSRQLLNLVPHDVADRFCLVPIYVRHVRNQGDTLYVAMDDPSNEEGLRACREHAGLPVRSMIAPPADIRNAIRVYYGIEPSKPPTVVAATLPVAAKPEPPPDAATVREPKLQVIAPAEPAAEPAPARRPRPQVMPESHLATTLVSASSPVAAIAQAAASAAEQQKAAAAPQEAPAVREVDRDAQTVAPQDTAAAGEIDAHTVAQQETAAAGEIDAQTMAQQETAAAGEVDREAETVAPHRASEAAEQVEAAAPVESASIHEEPTLDAPPPVATISDGPEIEAVEIPVDLSRAEALRAVLEQPASTPSEPPVENIPRPRGRAPRMVSLTLLDGTTINLPARRRPRARPSDSEPEPAPPPPSTPTPGLTSEPPPGPEAVQGLTARDLVLALRVVAHGADASEVLGSNVSWESLFAALLSLMLKKHLIADWEFVDELKKNL